MKLVRLFWTAIVKGQCESSYSKPQGSLKCLVCLFTKWLIMIVLGFLMISKGVEAGSRG